MHHCFKEMLCNTSRELIALYFAYLPEEYPVLVSCLLHAVIPRKHRLGDPGSFKICQKIMVLSVWRSCKFLKKQVTCIKSSLLV